VAVITGGASGIGRALADAFAAEGMRLVLADVEAPALDKAAGELRDGGHDVTGVVTDVTDPESVRALADAAFERYGAIHVLCNNAGVGPPSAKVWETTPNDWRWTFGVNVFAVVDGIRDGRFVIMLDPDGRSASTLRARLEKVLRSENPTEVHQLGS